MTLRAGVRAGAEVPRHPRGGRDERLERREAREGVRGDVDVGAEVEDEVDAVAAVEVLVEVGVAVAVAEERLVAGGKAGTVVYAGGEKLKIGAIHWAAIVYKNETCNAMFRSSHTDDSFSLFSVVRFTLRAPDFERAHFRQKGLRAKARPIHVHTQYTSHPRFMRHIAGGNDWMCDG